MGLDMYVYRTNLAIPKVGKDRPVDTVVDDTKCRNKDGSLNWDKYEKAKAKFEVCYWRKHPNLHGWFEALWNANGGKGDPDCFGGFNGDDWVRIDPADLDALEAEVKAQRLPQTSGFFFGHSYGDSDEMAYDLKFIAKARRQLAKGYHLLYTSSW